MKTQTKNQYDSLFTTVELNITKALIIQYVSSGGWSEVYEDDLYQEVFMHLWKMRDRYIHQEKYANYVKMIVKNKILSLIEKRDTKSRRPEGKIISLDEVHSLEELSEILTFEDTIADKSAIPPGDPRLDIYDNMWNVVKNEKPIFQSIFKLWFEGHSVKSMAEELGMKRTTLSDYVQKFKRMMREAGLEDYLK